MTFIILLLDCFSFWHFSINHHRSMVVLLRFEEAPSVLFSAVAVTHRPPAEAMQAARPWVYSCYFIVTEAGKTWHQKMMEGEHNAARDV